MQNRYSGDVGDFGKFGLIRHLVNDSKYHLGINWYLHPDEGHNDDGKFVEYLSGSKYKECDEELHKKLKAVVLQNKRAIKTLEDAQLFNCRTSYFSDNLDFYSKFSSQSKSDKEKRLVLRKEWQDRAISKLSNSNVLFLDPDNGLEIASCKSLNQKKSSKFAYFDEINRFHGGKAFTLIYHHLNRHKDHGTHSEQIKQRSHELKNKINSVETVYCLRYTPYSPRAFFILATEPVNIEIKKKLNTFLGKNEKSRWARYWDNYFECG